MRNPLLDRSLPEGLADLGQVVEAEEKLETFSRLAGIVDADLSSLPEDQVSPEWRQTPVKIRLRFSRVDAGGRLPAVEGRVTTRIPAVCQRCLGPMELALDEELKWLLPAPGETAGACATGGFEVWEPDEATIRPLDILEEVLIMAMPLSAIHGSGEGCDAPAEARPPANVETNRPFAGLRSEISGGEGSETDSSD